MIKRKYLRSAIRDSPSVKTIKPFLEYNEAIRYLTTHVRNTSGIKTCVIFTYGIEAGIIKKDIGTCVHYPRHVNKEFLDALNTKKIKTHIFCGTPTGTESEILYKKAEALQNTYGIPVNFYRGHHKLLYMDDGWGYIGSANFTGSSIGDLLLCGNLTEIIPHRELKGIINTLTKI